MADYSDLKVTELKDELKRRSIPTTNLTRKQQIIDRLIEDDKGKEASADNAADEPEVDAQQESAAQGNTSQEIEHEDEAKEPSADPKEPEEPEEPEGPVAAVSVLAPAEDSSVPATESVDPTPALSTAEEPSAGPSEEPAPKVPTTQAVDKTQTETEIATASASAQPEADAAVTPLSQTQNSDGTPDNRKRKRRSATPPIREESVSKKLKQVDEEHGDIAHLENDGDAPSAPVNGAASPKEELQVDMPDAPLDIPDATIQPMATSDDVMDISETHPAETKTENDTEAAIRRGSDAAQNKSIRSPNQRRFKDMLNNPAPSTQQATQSAIDDGIEVSPALHPATRSLYVRELVRPININALKDHLEQLATPPGQSASGELVEECYVDTLKTHAFVMFNSISAASRARASLHARVWPSEAQRKPLWVDFIPEERMSPWIDQERAEGGSRASTARRWEVAYDVLDDKVDVNLVEAAAAGQSRPSVAQGMPGAPLGPRSSLPGPQRSSFSQNDRSRPPQSSSSQRPTAKAVEEASASFLELDKLFKFTTSKPKLYWQPVSEELADKRLDEIDRETSRDWDPKKDAKLNGSALGRGLDQLKRYTFEDGDVLVDGGPEFGGGAAFGVGRGGGGGRGGGRRGADRYR